MIPGDRREDCKPFGRRPLPAEKMSRFAGGALVENVVDSQGVGDSRFWVLVPN